MSVVKKITTIEDGERFIIVTEGISSEIIKKIIGEIAGSNFTELKPMDIEPVPINTDVSDIITLIDEPKFQEGPYKDKKPEEIINEADALTWMTEGLKNDIFSDILKENCYKTIKVYLADKFKNADPQMYSNKLTERQITIFLNRYCYIVPKNILEDIANNSKIKNIEILKSSNDTESKRRAVSSILKYILQ